MPLSAPPNYSNSALAIAIGSGLALVCYCLTRSTLPHVGDNIHSLPHGGFYRDGTKSIAYGKPSGRFPASALLSSGGEGLVFLIVILLSGLIWYTSRGLKKDTPSCHICKCQH